VPVWTTVTAFVLAVMGFSAAALAARAAVPAFAAAAVVGGWPIARKGLRAARQGRLDMNALMSIAVVGAGLLGEWGEAASTVVLFSLAQLLEARSLERARRALSALSHLLPEQARVRDEEGERLLRVNEVPTGVHIVVGPGERVPLDGLVTAGESEVDESPLTGESKPAVKARGAEVFAGSINGPGALDVRVTRAASETALSRIVRRVEEAQASRAPAQDFVDRFAAVYTPAVILAAGLFAVVPPLAGGGDFATWFYRALVLLVVSCPCALVISTPVSIVSALTAASTRGILIKGGAHLEAIGRVTTVAFDKTGTLTEGAPSVTKVVALGGGSEAEVLSAAAAVEARSGHSIGRAVVQKAAALGLPVVPAQEVTARPGRGVSGIVDGRRVQVGSHRWFDELGLCDHRVDEELAALERAGCTAMLVAVEGRGLLGYMGVADDTRPEAAAAVAELRRGSIHVALLSGDNRRTAEAVGERVGIEDRRAELLPDDKVAAVRKLERERGPVAMVGDGVNDAPALASSTVGIALGNGASDVTLETADIALLTPDLRLVPAAIGLGRRTARVVRANVILSLGTKAIVLALTLLGYGTLWAAVAADMGTSLVVIANGLTLLRFRAPRDQ
jgi:Cd2+/Zn2+-exporting ATPase